MSRRKARKKIIEPPKFSGYKPYGTHEQESGYVELLYEEYEAIKLTDYYLENHDEACQLMGVSRATFARIYESARRKIAQALVETKEIKSLTGNAYLDTDWFLCHDCYARFPIIKKRNRQYCPECESGDLEPIGS
ncbi:MAG: DUF134 domain-containing protein [Bacteroidota bacterium]